LTTAGVTAFATSVNPFEGAAFSVKAAGVAAEAAELDACDVVSDWPPQIRRALNAETAMTRPIV
jgi:hypothetical protein